MSMQFNVYSPRALSSLVPVYASTPAHACATADAMLDVLESADRVDEMRDQYATPYRTPEQNHALDLEVWRTERDRWLALNEERAGVEEGLVPEGCR